MAIARRSVTTTTASATSITGTKPAGCVENDCLIAIVACDDQSEDIEVADGLTWERVILDANPDFTYALFVRVAGASEPASYSFRRVDLTSDPFNLTLLCYSGVNPANPIDTNLTHTRLTSDTLALNGVTTTIANTMAIITAGVPSNVTVVTPPASWTLAADNTGFQPGTVAYELAMAVAGATGNPSIVFSASITGRGEVFALRPASGYSYVTSLVGAGANVDNGGSALAWSNPGNITTQDATSATLTTAATAASDYLTGSSRGVSIPVGSTIKGHEVNVIRWQRSGGTSGEVRDNVVQLLDGSGAGVGSNKALTSVNWTTGLPNGRARIYGDPDDTWSAGLTVADVNDADSGVRIAVAGSTAGSNRVANIDAVRIITYYTPPLYTGTFAGQLKLVGAVTGDYADPVPVDDAPIRAGSSTGGSTERAPSWYFDGSERRAREEREERKRRAIVKASERKPDRELEQVRVERAERDRRDIEVLLGALDGDD